MDEVRTLFREYAASLNAEPCFENFARELAELPGTYDPILLSATDLNSSGCVALRALSESVGEMKRLYVRPEYRGKGLGRQLTEAIIQASRDRRYQALRLDTLPHLTEAIELYRCLGFRKIAPYCVNPVPGALFMELEL